MRQIINNQLQIGQVNIPDIQIDFDSRDEVPKILLGLQYIYCDPITRQEIFVLLGDLIPDDVRTDVGRWGMDLWKILVMGTLRLKCNWDYDHLCDQVNCHITIRQMLGHGMYDLEQVYSLQAIKDNVGLFTPDILDRINQVLVKAGHRLLGEAETPLKGQVDSFVVETDVHFPTDLNLLWDALRKIIVLIVLLCEEHDIVGWRKFKYWQRQVKQAYRKAQKAKHSTSKDTKQQAKKERAKKVAHQDYIDLAETLILRVDATLAVLPKTASAEKIREICYYLGHAQKQVDLIRRRVINGEKIPHEEKVFSLFEPYTRWISKGKAGVPQELGLPVCIMRDQHGFILDHVILEEGVDVDIAVSFTRQVKEKFARLNQCSYDKGFQNPSNQKELADLLDVVILPKKGRLSAADKERESSEAFVTARKQHSAVESAINALEQGGLDRCPDHGVDGFKRYTGLAVLGQNLQRIGYIIQQQARKKKKQEQQRLAA